MRAFVFAALTALSLSSAVAAPFPVADATTTTTSRVENVLDPVKRSYQVSATSNCSVAGVCQIQFPATLNENTLILHVSCGFLIASGGSVVEAYLNGDGGSNANFLAVSQYSPGANGDTVNIINTATYYFLAKGKKPQIDVLTVGTAAQSMQCTLEGYFS